MGFDDYDYVLELREIFDIIDENHSGELDINELRTVIEKLYTAGRQGRAVLTSEVLWSLFYALDLDPFACVRCNSSSGADTAQARAHGDDGADTA